MVQRSFSQTGQISPISAFSRVFPQSRLTSSTRRSSSSSTRSSRAPEHPAALFEGGAAPLPLGGAGRAPTARRHLVGRGSPGTVPRDWRGGRIRAVDLALVRGVGVSCCGSIVMANSPCWVGGRSGYQNPRPVDQPQSLQAVGRASNVGTVTADHRDGRGAVSWAAIWWHLSWRGGDDVRVVDITRARGSRSRVREGRHHRREGR